MTDNTDTDTDTGFNCGTYLKNTSGPWCKDNFNLGPSKTYHPATNFKKLLTDEILGASCTKCENGNSIKQYFNPEIHNSFPYLYQRALWLDRDVVTSAFLNSGAASIPMFGTQFKDMIIAGIESSGTKVGSGADFQIECPVEKAYIKALAVNKENLDKWRDEVSKEDLKLAENQAKGWGILFGDSKDGLLSIMEETMNGSVNRLQNKIYIDLVGLAIAIIMVIVFLK